MARRYAKRRSSRRRRKRRGKKTRASSSKAWKRAKAAVSAVLKKAAQPLYVRKVYGNYNDANGQFETQVSIASGPDGGYIDTNQPLIAVPSTTAGAGMPGSRKDNEISITGIKCSFRFELPQNVSQCKVKAYLFLDKDGKRRMDESDPLYPVQFKAPDEFYMLRDEPDTRANMHNIHIIKSREFKIRSNPNSSGTNQSRTFRDMNLWWKPKGTGFKFKYVGDAADEYLNRCFGICIKTSFPDNAAGDQLTFGGVVTTYYRDYS